MTDWKRSFRHARTGQSSTSLRKMYRQCSDEERQLSGEFFDRYPTGRGTGVLSAFTGILQDPGPLAGSDALVRGHQPHLRGVQAAEDFDLETRLSRALAEALPDTLEVAVAVSGGVDSWLMAALLQRLGYSVCGWYLETGIPGYCEREQVERSSKALGIECRYIRVTVRDFIESVADFTAVTETPIYNLHPVSKWLLARGLRREGIRTLVTGDAADQVMRWDWDCDLLPLTIACFQGAGIRMVAPFLAPDVIAFCRKPYPDKEPVRDLARKLGVPVVVKQPTLFPAVTLPLRPRASLPSAGAISDAGHKPANEDRVACLAFSTGLLQQFLEDDAPCAV